MVTTRTVINRRFIARAADRISFCRGYLASAGALLLATFLAACGHPTTSLDLRFEARFDGQPIDCTAANGVALTDLRFYVHDVMLTAHGERVGVQLDDDARWQDGRVGLVDLETGSGACRNGSAAINDTIRARAVLAADAAEYELSFIVGVPEPLNHANPLTAPAPRNDSSMHWHWRSGYKFMRVGVETDSDVSWLHLGSSRCRGTIAAIEGCASANRPSVRIASFDPERDVVVLDVARLLGPTRLNDSETWSCESGPAEEQCAVAFAELGLDFAGGEVLGPAPAFHARRVR